MALAAHLQQARHIFRWALQAVLAGLLVLGSARAAPASVEFKSSDTELALGRGALVLEDSSGSLAPDAVFSGRRAWAMHETDTFNFGFSKSVWWVRLSLHNLEAGEVPRVLDLGSSLQDEIDVYVLRSHGAPIEHIATGDRRPFDARPVETRAPSVPMRFAPGEQVDVYIRLATHDGLHEGVALKLWSPKAHARAMQSENLVHGLYYGTLVAVLAYNLFLFMATRQRSFGLYAMYVCSFFVWSFTLRGYAFQYLWPAAPDFNNQILAVAAGACFSTFAVFIVNYVGAPRRTPRWHHRVLVGSAVGNALCIVPALLDFYAFSFAAIIFFSVAMMVSAFAMGVPMLRRGSRPARYALLSFALLTVGVLVYYLRLLSVLPSNAFTENFLQVGSAAQVLLLAFGLADQVNQLRESKLRAEREALAAKTALADELESLVQRRTKALKSVNRRLSASSVTDDLTGAYNLRHFDERLASEVARHARSGAPIALCLFDIDQLRRYNDRHGHPGGDMLLQRVANTVLHRLRRRGDQLFRIDGGQFALLLNVDPASSLLDFVERVRADIEAQHLVPAADGPGEYAKCSAVTASFGLVVVAGPAAVLNAQELMEAAGRLLAQAKRDGRNAVRAEIKGQPPEPEQACA